MWTGLDEDYSESNPIFLKKNDVGMLGQKTFGRIEQVRIIEQKCVYTK